MASRSRTSTGRRRALAGPCEMLAHLAGGGGQGQRYETMLRGQDVPPAPTRTEEERETLINRPSEATPIPDMELAPTAVSGIRMFRDALHQPGALERTVNVHLGDFSGEDFARLGTFDLLLHCWDIATALGKDVGASDALVADVDNFARSFITPEMRLPYTFGPEVEPPPGASALERLVAFSGRAV